MQHPLRLTVRESHSPPAFSPFFSPLVILVRANNVIAALREAAGGGYNDDDGDDDEAGDGDPGPLSAKEALGDDKDFVVVTSPLFAADETDDAGDGDN